MGIQVVGHVLTRCHFFLFKHHECSIGFNYGANCVQINFKCQPKIIRLIMADNEHSNKFVLKFECILFFALIQFKILFYLRVAIDRGPLTIRTTFIWLTHCLIEYCQKS